MMNCLSMYIINTIPLESALYGIYALVFFLYQQSHFFAVLTSSIPDATQ